MSLALLFQLNATPSTLSLPRSPSFYRLNQKGRVGRGVSSLLSTGFALREGHGLYCSIECRALVEMLCTSFETSTDRCSLAGKAEASNLLPRRKSPLSEARIVAYTTGVAKKSNQNNQNWSQKKFQAGNQRGGTIIRWIWLRKKVSSLVSPAWQARCTKCV